MDRRPRFLIVAGFAKSLVVFRGRLISAIRSAGYDVHAAAPDLDESVRKDLVELGAVPHEIPLERGGMDVLSSLRSTAAIRRLLRALDVEVVLAYTIKPIVFTGLALTGISRVRFYPMITGLGYAFSDETQGRSLVRRTIHSLYRNAVRHARAIIFQNRDDESEFRERGLLRDSDQSFVVNGSGVDLGHFRPQAVPRTARFLMISRLVKSKGVLDFIAAAGIVRERFPEAEFALICWGVDGPDRLDEAEVQESAASVGIEYIGYTSDVRTELARCSVYVLPSYYREGIPRTILEALATGRAVITCDMPGCRETVIDGENGCIVPVRDPAAIADAMREFVESPQRAETMGARSLELARNRFDDEIVNQSMLEILIPR